MNLAVTIVAFLLAPIGAIMAYLIIGVVSDGAGSELGSVNLGIVFLMYIYALMFSVILGAPAYFTVRKVYGTVEWWLAAFGGALIGVASVLLILLPFTVNKLILNVKTILLYGMLGAAGGLMFWFVLWLGKSTSVSSENEK